MAINRICYDGTDHTRQCLSDQSDIEYAINGGVMYAYWHGKRCRIRPRKDEIYTIIVNRSGFPEIKRGLPPTAPADLLAWLLGFTSAKRIYNRAIFDNHLSTFRLSLSRKSFSEYRLHDDGYDFVYWASDSQIVPLISYVDANLTIDAALIAKILHAFHSEPALSQSNLFRYSPTYLRRLFCQSLHISATDCDYLLALFSGSSS